VYHAGPGKDCSRSLAVRGCLVSRRKGARSLCLRPYSFFFLLNKNSDNIGLAV
jgi:hypothetical protein